MQALYLYPRILPPPIPKQTQGDVMINDSKFVYQKAESGLG